MNEINQSQNYSQNLQKNPPTRNWVPEVNLNEKNNYIRVMSYNILCDSLTSISTNTKESELAKFPFMKWENRRTKILAEIKLHSPDILCIQELERDEVLLNTLAEMGYDVNTFIFNFLCFYFFIFLFFCVLFYLY